MAKIHKKKKVDLKMIWLSKPTPKTRVDKLDGRRKAGTYTGMFDGSKPILPLVPISESRLNEQEENIRKIKESKKGAAWKRPKVKKTK